MEEKPLLTTIHMFRLCLQNKKSQNFSIFNGSALPSKLCVEDYQSILPIGYFHCNWHFFRLFIFFLGFVSLQSSVLLSSSSFICPIAPFKHTFKTRGNKTCDHITIKFLELVDMERKFVQQLRRLWSQTNWVLILPLPPTSRVTLDQLLL